MAKQTIGVGAVANDGLGDQLRTAFIKTNDNTDEIYAGTATVVRATVPTLPYGVAGDLAGMIAYDTAYVYVCVADYVNDTTVTWHRIAMPAPAGFGTW